jgi:NitT/TauT family transport system substrate-binding protein
MSTNTRRKATRSIVLALASAALAGAGLATGALGAASAAAPAKPVTSITLGVAAGNGPGNADLAKAKGYFAAEGLNVTIKPLTGAGAEAIAGLDSGSLTIVESNVVSVIQGAAHGINAPCFTGGVDFRNNLGADVFEASKAITKPSDLAGKSIGVISTNSYNTLEIDAYLSAEHVNYRSVHYVATGVTNTLAALKAGSVQAAELVAPFSLEYLKQGGHLLVEDFEPYLHTPLFACWTALRPWIGTHKATIAKFIAALNKADAFYYAHPAEAAKLIAPIDGLPAAANLPADAFTYTTAMTGGQLAQLIALSKHYGVVTGKVSLGQVYEPVG